MKRKRTIVLAAALCMVMSVAAPLASFAEETEMDVSSVQEGEISEVAAEPVAGVTIYVQGYEWGPGVPKVILEFEREVSEVSASDLTIQTAGMERTVRAVYPSDANGNSADGASRYVTIEMETTNEVSGSPFTYDLSVLMNKWSESYPVVVTSEDFVIDGESRSLSVNEDCINSRICPDTDRFNYRGSYTGTYRNNYTGQDEQITLRTAAYEPTSLAGGEQNPLVIWVHGQGEGGTDVEIELIGNEVVALARDEIQSYFTAGDQTGAYVLAVQCETYWMDEGDGTNGLGSGVSRYTEALMDAIQDYVAKNTDVDPNRIYLGGCSNGGYMTINMLVNYPDYFAAAYANCAAYSYYEYTRNEDGSYAGERTDSRWVDEETVEKLKEIPIWFILSIDDQVVDPTLYELPTYRALVQAGAENCWLSVFESIEGTDSPGTTYIGHYAWVYALNNQVTGIQNVAAVAASTDTVAFGTTPTNQGGGTETANGYNNLFAWLNAQSKG
ncbi:MAG: prolyl oligopeptidase family serine peptidase [Clostridiales bacterium]|nr:prolyl oligopeptidase family serine peptidase [Clostridiales bacterium]